jgi:hypothetical protein
LALRRGLAPILCRSTARRSQVRILSGASPNPAARGESGRLPNAPGWHVGFHTLRSGPRRGRARPTSWPGVGIGGGRSRSGSARASRVLPEPAQDSTRMPRRPALDDEAVALPDDGAHRVGGRKVSPRGSWLSRPLCVDYWTRRVEGDPVALRPVVDGRRRRPLALGQRLQEGIHAPGIELRARYPQKLRAGVAT